ncbi:hypothetical protein [Kaarinaea lacus]
MSKDVNRDSVVAHKKKCSNSQDNISKLDNILSNKETRRSKTSSLVSHKHPDFVISQNRLNRLKQSIGSGNFIINPTRVAEKLILFETQLLA